ncbi:hypothetical protein MRX96_004629 [Rhipicephalus microplus]|uniref:Uncharacterized protein n=1 Tax=Rhipicephalus microplus TaxID=6941 RepID=A0A6M2D8E4_RHIMP
MVGDKARVSVTPFFCVTALASAMEEAKETTVMTLASETPIKRQEEPQVEDKSEQQLGRQSGDKREKRGRSEERLILPSAAQVTSTAPAKPTDNQSDGFANDSQLDQPSSPSSESSSEEGSRRKRQRRNSSPARLAHSITATGAAPKGDPEKDPCAIRGPPESPHFPSPPPSPVPMPSDLIMSSQVLYLPVLPRSDTRTEAEAFVEDVWPC